MLPAPAHVNQFSAGGVFQSGPRKGQGSGPWDCMVAVGIMGLDAATAGAIRLSATDFRARQRDQIKGIGLNDVADAWRSTPGAPRFSYGLKLWPSVAARLAAGDGLAMPGRYSTLGAERAPGSTFTGPHGLYIQRKVAGGFLVNDPLRAGPAVLSEPAIRRFYLSGGAQAGWAEGAAVGAGPPGLTIGTNPAADLVSGFVVNGVVLVVVLGLGWAGVKRLLGGSTHALLIEAPSAAARRLT